jgi:hypothetical protein
MTSNQLVKIGKKQEKMGQIISKNIVITKVMNRSIKIQMIK